jgi:hypothetical protein
MSTVRRRSSPRFHRVFNLSFGLRFTALCLVCVALFIWYTPQMSSFLSLSSLAALHHLFTPNSGRMPPGTAHEGQKMLQFWQVGLEAGQEDVNSIGARSTIQTRLPQRVSVNTTDYFWVGAYLRDNSFIQVGYYVPWYDESHAGWFYCAFYSNGREGPCTYGALGSAGANDTQHSYAMQAETSSTGRVSWNMLVDSRQVGSFTWSSASTGTNVPMIYAESSGFTPHPSTSQLGPADFLSGLQVLLRGAAGYQPAAHLFVMYSASSVCPPFGIRNDGHGGVLLGSGLPCPVPYAEFG